MLASRARIWVQYGHKGFGLRSFHRCGSALGKAGSRWRYHCPPKIRLAGDHLSWSLRCEGTPPKAVRPDREMLNSFVTLWERDPAALLKFAGKWGVLFLDSAGRPGHSLRPETNEVIDSWRYWSRRAYSVLRIGANLRRRQLGDPDDWRALDGTFCRTGDLLDEVQRYVPLPLAV